MTEVAIGVQFGEIRRLNGPRMGLVWERYRREFPNLEVHPALDPQFERDAPDRRKGLRLTLDAVPTPRAWFLTDDRSRLIQIQNDRFVFNWRRIDGADYPRYQQVKEEFIGHYKRFREFLSTESLGGPRLNQWEITYVNHIPAGGPWRRHGELGAVVPMLTVDRRGGFLPDPEDVELRVRYRMPTEQGSVSRLYVRAQPVFGSSDRPVVALTLTARGGLSGHDDRSLHSRLDVGREWIVRGFAEVTSEAIHLHWGREA